MFENVKISETAKTALEAAAADRRIPHAVIFEGTDEHNRLEAAYSLAKAAVCAGEKPPCGECRHCLKAEHRSHPDIIVLSKPEKKSMYSVDDIRNVKKDAYVIPGEAECKVYIFSEAQYLDIKSQNTLLKLIEEPPQKAMFILTCPSVSYLLETVRSRAASFYLG
ncbi:MAG: ATP-binding protein, partial [Clostridia bacterium]|nr:ATP-binding protein [Clostridia bacterium]